MAYLTLFLSAFLAATFLPFYSEVVLITFLKQGYVPFALWAVGTTGNTLGASVNWAMGRYFLHYKNRKWFPISEASLARSQKGFQKYGKWTLLFSWLPVVGDALPLIAGIMRVPLPIFLVLTALGKGARYAVIIHLTQRLL